MTRTLTRTNFHSSKLIRALSDLEMVEAADPGNAFAEKLGLWIHFADAITLSSVHSGSLPGLPKPHAAPDAARAAARSAAGSAAGSASGIDQEFERIQSFLVTSIMKSCGPDSGRSHIKMPAAEFDLPLNPATAYVPYRRFYESHQRDMESSIQPLRTQVRKTVAKASPALQKLAELDATLEKILRERENKLLSKVPVLLRKRFEQLFKEHQKKLVDTQQADIPAEWTRAGGWLARFRSDMQMLLLAEVELRLQPAMGLIEAFKQEP
jgi:hypothetical protein